MSRLGISLFGTEARAKHGYRLESTEHWHLFRHNPKAKYLVIQAHGSESNGSINESLRWQPTLVYGSPHGKSTYWTEVDRFAKRMLSVDRSEGEWRVLDYSTTKPFNTILSKFQGKHANANGNSVTTYRNIQDRMKRMDNEDIDWGFDVLTIRSRKAFGKKRDLITLTEVLRWLNKKEYFYDRIGCQFCRS